MSAARWCDYGDHAFAADREGTIVMGKVVKNSKTRDAYGNETGLTQEVREMCPECAAELGLLPDYTAPALSPRERKLSMLEEMKDAKAAPKA